MKKAYFASLFAFLGILVLVIGASAEIDAIDTSGGWRLPFDGTMTITCAPGERPPLEANECDHITYTTNTGLVVKDQLAVDYANGTNFPVLAPANGTVLDSGNDPNGYGRWLRISHNSVYSFFAHLQTGSILVSPGMSVKQGDQIATSGDTGNTTGIHLHFDARSGATSGNPYSGNPSPTFAIPGNWFNAVYSPVPNLQWNDEIPSGGAQYPERKKRPTTTSPGARHLSNQQSPPNVLAGWMSNINTSAVTLHFGAAPDTPGTNWATVFSVYEFRQGCNCWSAIPGGPDITGPWWTVQIGSWNQSESNGQHTFHAFDENDIPLTSGDILRYWEVLPANPATEIPHLTASYRNTTTPTTLQFCSDAEKYKIYEDHGSGSQVAFNGVGCSIMVHRQVWGINRYSVAARVGGVWTSPSPWLVVHD